MEREFKDILTDFLKENGLSQSDFARKLGAKPDSVNDWERGKAKPDYDNLPHSVDHSGQKIHLPLPPKC